MTDALTLSIPEYRCHKGHVHEGSMQLSGFGDNLDGHYCMRCYAEWIAENVSKATRIEPAKQLGNGHMSIHDDGPLCTCGHRHGDHWEPTGADLPDERWPCLVAGCDCKDFTSDDTTPGQEGE